MLLVKPWHPAPPGQIIVYNEPAPRHQPPGLKEKDVKEEEDEEKHAYTLLIIHTRSESPLIIR